MQGWLYGNGLIRFCKLNAWCFHKFTLEVDFVRECVQACVSFASRLFSLCNKDAWFTSLHLKYIIVERFSILLSAVKPKQKLSPWPIITDADNPMNQSELKGNSGNWRQAREK